jgi:putative phage-type endonuclease
MLTPEQRELRKKYLGSSDISAVLGLNPYRSAADVYLEKTGQLAAADESDACAAGSLLEGTLVDWAAKEAGLSWTSKDLMVKDQTGMLCANCDAVGGLPNDANVISRADTIIEAKHSGLSEQWGEPGTGEVPPMVAAQIAHQFAVAGPDYRLCLVPAALIVGRRLEFRLYRVERDDAVAEEVARLGREFMLNHVRANVRPTDYRPSMDVLKRIIRVPGKIVTLDDAGPVEEWLAAKAALSEADSRAKLAHAAVVASLDDAEGAQLPDGRRLTYFEQSRKGFVVAPTTYKTLRLVTPKNYNLPPATGQKAIQ